MKFMERQFWNHFIADFGNQGDQKIAQYLVKANTESLRTLMFRAPYMTDVSCRARTRAL
jgi:hypothetical protein